MNSERALCLEQRLSPKVRVVDIGGGANPFPRADYVIDGLKYEDRGSLRRNRVVHERVTLERWVQIDLCARTPWPFPDNFFDFAVCTHVLEDVRDPVWVCSEMMRIAKAGYIETPSRIVEQSRGVEHPCYAGYCHHHWLVSVEGNSLLFRIKPHLLHVNPAAIVADVGSTATINPKYCDLIFEWEGAFTAKEVLCFDEREMIQELCEWAKTSRTLPDLMLRDKRTLSQRLKRWVYFERLRRQASKKIAGYFSS